MPTSAPLLVPPAVPSLRDSSHSRTYLTRANYAGPRLLRSINGSGTPASLSSDVVSEKEQSSAKDMNEADIFALPRDSSDDDKQDESSNASVQAKSPTPPPTKRTRPSTRDVRPSKRPKLKDQPNLLDDSPQEKVDTYAIPQSSAQSTEWDILASQGASQRRSQNNFKKYRKLPPTGLHSERADFKVPKAIPEKTLENNGTYVSKSVQPAVPAAEPRKAFKSFTIPMHDLCAPDSTGASQSTVLSDHLEGSPPSQKVQDPASSPPSTPLSQTANHEEPDSPIIDLTINVCPVCNKEVIRSHLNNPGMSIYEVRFYPMRRQQAFCHEHSLGDARAIFRERNYPDVDWFRLRVERIPKHKNFLRNVIHGKTNSHFVEELDAQIPDKTNRKQIHRYLDKARKETTLAPTGYYGAKGAQVMAEAIAQEMSRFLTGKIANEGIKTIGVGPFISNVLVPELTQRLVMEDMNIRDAVKARTIMQESAFAGMMLHPEDEKVERHDDD